MSTENPKKNLRRMILKVPVIYSPDQADIESVATVIEHLLRTKLGSINARGNPCISDISYDRKDDQPVFDLPMSQEDYVATEGKRCPYCGSDDLDRSEVSSLADRPAEGEADEECNKCERMWKSTWRMTGYWGEGDEEEGEEGEDPGDEDEARTVDHDYDEEDG